MRVAHIIMAHKNPSQVLRLIESLQHPNFDIYVHIDNKVDIDDFKLVTKSVNITFIKNRVNCYWGGNNFLKAIINSLTEVVLAFEYEFVNLISAQDYPIKPVNEIYDFLKNNQGKNYICFETSRNSDWWKKATTRYEDYHLTDINLKWKYFLQRIINKILPSKIPPDNFDLFGGSKSSWWTLSGDCSKFIATRLTDDKELWKFLKYSWGTDEFAIPSVIMNSHFKDTVVNDNYRYIDWSEGNAHPKLLRLDDLQKIKDSGMMFARKFDPNIDSEVLNKIDTECL